MHIYVDMYIHIYTYNVRKSYHKDTMDPVRLSFTATHCNTLQHAATHCITLHHTASHCNTLQHTASHKRTRSVPLF